MKMGNAILDAALKYAENGLSVIPISKTKQPCIKWQALTREDLTNPDNIRKWWRMYPTANVAIVTGARSGGLVVIDLDIDDDKGIDGVDALEEWCEQNDVYEITSQAEAVTGRGGRHLYFRSPFPYHNQVGCLRGVDIRGEGGCIVAPPSVHENGNVYAWDTDTDDINIPLADSDVTYFLGTMEAGDKKASHEKVHTDYTEPVGEGGRNKRLFDHVADMQGKGHSDEYIREEARTYNAKYLQPPLDDSEVTRTVESVLKHKEWKGTQVKEQPQPAEQPKKEYKFPPMESVYDLMHRDIQQPLVFVGVGSELPLLVEGTCILSAKAKMGKSWFILGMCMAIATGEDFLGYKTRKCSTLYFDLETGDAVEQSRFGKYLRSGGEPPKNFHLIRKAWQIGDGFVEQIEYYLEADPDIGVVVIDVFQIIRPGSKNSKETEYERAYRDIGSLNELAQKHHISIILVCHDRKAVDPDDPFSNILGSTGLQGAASQMIVMFKRRISDRDEPIHICVKGKTIDGLPELNVMLKDARWEVVSEDSPQSRELAKAEREYMESDIRAAVLKIIDDISKNPPDKQFWQGSCTKFRTDAAKLGVPVVEEVKYIGGFFTKHIARFLAKDHVMVDPVKNGTGGRQYKIYKHMPLVPLITVDENDTDFESAEEYGLSRIPFMNS